MPKAPRKKRLGSRLLVFTPTRVLIELYMRLLALWVTLPGPGWAYWWARRAAALGWLLLPRLRKVALRNLDLCFPEKPEAERTRIARASFRHFCYTFVDYLLAPRHCAPGRWHKHYTPAADDDPFVLFCHEGKPSFVLSAHFGNWEIGTISVGRLTGVKPLLVIAKPIQPPLLNRWIVNARRALRNEVFEHTGGARAYARAIKESRLIAVLVDQNGGDFAPVETFFGVPCTWQADFTRMALRGNVRISHTFAVRVGERFQFAPLPSRILAYPPGADPMQLVRDYRDSLERVIREHPEQYFWMHRRFKARKEGWPDRYAALGRRLTPELRAEMIGGAPSPASPRAQST
ncbi:MAG: hypothetical protein IT463_03850 [Planctomycetes bacterium]|nr:hypothetical protein [Planctomycetota bacterium]